MDYFWLILGFVVLIFGGDFLVKGAVGIAVKANISTLVIGMTVVSFGTSAPELLVSLGAAMQGGEESMMSVGNVIGSNIANLALVLGITAIIYPIPVKKNTINKDFPILALATILFIVFMAFFDGEDLFVNRIEGLILFILIVYVTYKMIRDSRIGSTKEVEIDIEDVDVKSAVKRAPYLNFIYIVFGCVGLIIGAQWLLESATNIAVSFGISKYVIGVTILAFGTSVPELVTSAVAAYRKETDIAIGNLIGSNIFNILCVVGLTGAITGMPLPETVLTFDAWWMLGISLLLYPLMISGNKIHRWKGFLLVGVYGAYLYFLL